MLDFQEKFLIFFFAYIYCHVWGGEYKLPLLCSWSGDSPPLAQESNYFSWVFDNCITSLLKTKEPLQRLNRELDMNIFRKVKMYATKWQETSCRNFTPEEIAAVERAEIVASQYGNSVCFFMVEGGQCYIPLDRDSTLGVGESVDLHAAKLKTLSKQGEDDIMRVSI